MSIMTIDLARSVHSPTNSTNKSLFRIWQCSLRSLFFHLPRANIHNIYMFPSLFFFFFFYRPGELSISSICVYVRYLVSLLPSFRFIFLFFTGECGSPICFPLYLSFLRWPPPLRILALSSFYFSIFKRFSAAVHTPLNLSYLFAYTSKYLHT